MASDIKELVGRYSGTDKPAESATDPKTTTPADGADAELGKFIQWFEDAENGTEEGRAKGEGARDYYDNDQLTTAEKAKLAARGQPDTIKNRIKRKIDFLTGFEATQRSDPKAFPRNPQDEESAEAATDMLRYQEQASDLDQLFSDVWEHMLIEGFGGVEVLGPSKTNPNMIEVLVWPWDRLFHDPHSRKHDFSDAHYKGGVMWMDETAACAQWPDKADIIKQTVAAEPSNSQTYEDRPSNFVSWAEKGNRNRVRIVQIYYKEGDQLCWALFCKAGVITSGKVEFVDENGEPDDPFILQSAYVNRRNQRYGIVEELKGPQDEINKRTQKSLHLIMTKSGMYEEGTIPDVAKFKTERAKPDGMAMVAPGALSGQQVRMDDHSGDIAGNQLMLNEAKQEIDAMGPNAALAGKQEAGASGRAIRASQEGGVIEIARLRDRHTHFKRRVYRAIWNRCRQFLGEETWIRVTDDEKNIKFVGFNRPLTFAEAASKELQGKGATPEQLQELISQAAAELGVDPNMAIGQTNVLADMDMDIIIENATEAINIQEEQFEQLVKLAPVVPMPPAVYLAASSLRNKDRLTELLAGDPQAQAEQAKAAQAKFKVELDKTVSETLKNQTQAAKNMADARAKDVASAVSLTPQPAPVEQLPGEPQALMPPQAPPEPIPEAPLAPTDMNAILQGPADAGPFDSELQRNEPLPI